MSNTLSNESYTDLIKNLKQEISKARIRAHLAVNKELIALYISDDVRKEFPEMKGLAYQNLSYMRQFFAEYNNDQILQQAVGEIPWSHNIFFILFFQN
ncbi:MULTISPECIES: DUF1016 N-terminal domain-containing protein [spotted fever group]|uniref:YhcG N-terminal domain-containing protein n=2 Tax=spotted fever group TaxID=114277 RepID=A0A0F3PH46_RICRH|nr:MULTISPECIES: DUF1016 N-terminal domain-containing protein [spotted fever group]AFB31984.1 hypothetical protein RMB_06315 [Rickettsia massiliae str. AZT80]KJV79267.1 hypothetical protein RMAECT_0969 [Rickettsia rhipicephali str. Ect]